VATGLSEAGRRLAVGGIALLLFGTTSVDAQSAGPVVKTDAGAVAGTIDAAGIRVFKGIPYAAPPVGDLRWKEPQPVASWTGTRDATQFGDRCQQTAFPAYSPIGTRGMSENCLFVNVWSAPHANHAPVLVWIHGGGFGYGYSNQAEYDGDRFAQKGLVFVNLNYRVGAFGFLALPGLTQESPHKTSGNYGILDQIDALQWVQRNIAAFGGDPENVTIFGESAGSISVSLLTASPLAKGLFHRAIGDSGAGLGTIVDTLPIRPLAWEEQRGMAFASALHARSVAELRSVSAAEIADVGEHGREHLFSAGVYAPNIDGYLLHESPARTFARGGQNDVALITGWNLHESTVWMEGNGRDGNCAPVWANAETAQTFTDQAKRTFGSGADAVLALYPHATDDEAKASAGFLAGDLIIAWSGWKWADLQSRSGRTTTFLYFFAKMPPAQSPFGVATHGSEIAYAFDNLQAHPWNWDSMDAELAQQMSSYYANFVKTGNPNGPGLPVWPVYRPAAPQRMIFDEHGALASSFSLATFHQLEKTPPQGPWCPATPP
jgi:para-nitrobenzyl esterase